MFICAWVDEAKFEKGGGFKGEGEGVGLKAFIVIIFILKLTGYIKSPVSKLIIYKLKVDFICRKHMFSSETGSSYL